MKSLTVLFIGTVILFVQVQIFASTSKDPLASETQQIIQEIEKSGRAYDDLKELLEFGHRLAGGPGAAKAIEWAQAKMKTYHFDRVWVQPVMVPYWVRGDHEQAKIVDSNESLAVAALGGSVGTPTNGIEAEVVEVQSLREVEKIGKSGVRGKIVFYNRAMDPALTDKFEAYGGAVDQRVCGAAKAAQFGALAVLVRSLSTLTDDDHPHTGSVNYRQNIPAIPAAALSTRAANRLASLLKEKGAVRVNLQLSAKRLPDVESFNVVGELRGAKFPDEVIVVGGHLDSWDLGVGAHDDGAGVVQSLETLRAIKALEVKGIKPQRTLRAVFFTAEEFGGFGGKEYARLARLAKEKSLAAIESDRGGFAPRGFTVERNPKVLMKVQSWAQYLTSINAGAIGEGESGTDVGRLRDLGTATFGYIPDSTHYFDLHHSDLDQFSAINPNELSAGAAAMAVFAYLISEKGL